MNAARVPPLILKGHQAAVWAAVELFSGTYATASADKTIKLWMKDGTIITTLTGKEENKLPTTHCLNVLFLLCDAGTTASIF